MELKEIVMRLTGEINPVGETNEDNRRFENLKNLTELVNDLMTEIDYVAMKKDRHEYSISRAGKFASDFYTKLGIEE